jgi:hypothetical protein|tara:strand:+ start:658 stop:1161 length:504 start_codon:yes stop_codon:yes gene_type:complete
MKKITERYKDVADLWVDIENIFILIYLGVGAYGMLGLRYNSAPVASIFYISCAIVLVLSLTMLHKTSKGMCFGKRYASAWGIVAAEIYKKGNCKNPRARMLAQLTITVVTAIPIAVMGFLLYYHPFSRSLLNVMVLFLGLTVVQFWINKEFRKRFSMDYEKAPEAYK